jgi:tRNA threonylcarbamoyladenosine biosynthesis protein TsaE
MDTDRLAKIVSDFVFRGFLILANGDLGAGKTRFAKGLALNLGVSDTVTSPTFNILKCYEGNDYDFYHIDAYRLEGIKQDLGLEEFIEGDGVCFVEWSEYIDYLLPNEFLKLNIRIDENQSRIFEIEGKGEKYLNIEKEIERLW